MTPHQPFWACRCFRSELRRVIRAFAMRTASVLGDGFFGCVSAPPVGRMRNCVGAIEPCWAGCVLIGPVRVDLFPGITDNAQHSSSFDGFGENDAVHTCRLDKNSSAVQAARTDCTRAAMTSHTDDKGVSQP